MGRYFGTDGFRGEANVTLTADHAYQVGRFLGWYCGETKRRAGDESPVRVVIGKDTRRSSYMFEYALASGLVASGADAYLLHVTTTPSVSYVTRTEGFDCGIMISASHNPFYDNGIKLIDRAGEKMDEDTIALIEDYLDGQLELFGQKWAALPLARREHIGRTVDHAAGRNRYVGYLISLGMFSFKGKKVGLDCANGSAWMIAKSVFDALGATTYVMGDQPDGFNINNGVGSTHIDALRQFVVEKGLDVGFAYDGDADRCLAVDERGNIITGDGILTSLKLMEVMLERKLPMSKLTEGLTIYPQVLENVRVKDKLAARQDADVQKAVEAVANKLGDTGRILVRESGTEPLLRVMVEAPEDDTCRACVDEVVAVIRAKGHAV